MFDEKVSNRALIRTSISNYLDEPHLSLAPPPIRRFSGVSYTTCPLFVTYTAIRGSLRVWLLARKDRIFIFAHLITAASLGFDARWLAEGIPSRQSPRVSGQVS